jgi:flagellin
MERTVALRINTNVEALNAYRHLSVVPTQQAGAAQSAQKVALAAGASAAAAADGSGLSVSELLRSQLSGLTQASRSAQNGLGDTQTADSALANTQTLLTRMRDITVQASSAVVVTAALAGMTAEVGALNNTIDTIASTTQFAGQSLLGAAGYSGSFTIGAPGTAASAITLTLPAATTAALGVTGLDISTPANAAVATKAVQGALDQVTETRSALGRFKSLFTQAVNTITVAVQNIASAGTSIVNPAMATDISSMARTQILAQPSQAMAAQSGGSTAALMKLLA